MKKLTAITTGSLATLLAAAPAFAQTSVNPCSTQSGFSGLCDISAENIGGVIQTIVTLLLVGAALIALFFLIWGGIRWITSGGDKGKVEAARNTIVAAIIGLVVAFLAFFILQLILNVFGLSLSNLTLPKFTQ